MNFEPNLAENIPPPVKSTNLTKTRIEINTNLMYIKQVEEREIIDIMKKYKIKLWSDLNDMYPKFIKTALKLCFQCVFLDWPA